MNQDDQQNEEEAPTSSTRPQDYTAVPITNEEEDIQRQESEAREDTAAIATINEEHAVEAQGQKATHYPDEAVISVTPENHNNMGGSHPSEDAYSSYIYTSPLYQDAIKLQLQYNSPSNASSRAEGELHPLPTSGPSPTSAHTHTTTTSRTVAVRPQDQAKVERVHSPPPAQLHNQCGIVFPPETIHHEPSAKGCPYYFFIVYFCFLSISFGAYGVSLIVNGNVYGAGLVFLALILGISVCTSHPRGCTVTRTYLIFHSAGTDYVLPFEKVSRVDHYANMCCNPVCVCVQKGVAASNDNVYIFHVADTTCSTAAFFSPFDNDRFRNILNTSTLLGNKIAEY